MKKTLIVAGIVVWFLSVILAFGLVWNYKTTPGAEGGAPAVWPHDSALVPAAGKPNLVVFAHPQCPCTRATMAELGRLAVEIGDRAQIHIVLVHPDGAPDGFEAGAIADRAAGIPNAEVIVDDEREARRFGSVTSGTTLLYTADGALAFSGGLTTARGHEGRSPAYDRILGVVDGDVTTGHAATAPVFGCELDHQLTAVAK